MAWRFERGEAFETGFRRVAADEIARTRAALTNGEVDRATAIHQARRSFKRMRALLRLAEPSLGTAFIREDRRYRNAGRLLASSRDATVAIETFDRLAKRCSETLAPAALASLRARLVAAAGSGEVADADRDMALVVAQLARAAENAGSLTWPASKSELRKGLKASQVRLKQCWKVARDNPTPTRLHEWRKRVKDYTAQVSLVRLALPHELKVYRKDSRELADILGEEHDLSVLRSKLLGLNSRGEVLRARSRLVEAIDERRTELCDKAFDLGKGLSSHRPKAFAEDIVSRLA